MSEKDYGNLVNLFCTMQFLIAYWYVFISKVIEIFICYLKLCPGIKMIINFCIEILTKCIC